VDDPANDCSVIDGCILIEVGDSVVEDFDVFTGEVYKEEHGQSEQDKDNTGVYIHDVYKKWIYEE
jgi:hypothetical protein